MATVQVIIKGKDEAKEAFNSVSEGLKKTGDAAKETQEHLSKTSAHLSETSEHLESVGTHSEHAGHGLLSMAGHMAAMPFELVANGAEAVGHGILTLGEHLISTPFEVFKGGAEMAAEGLVHLGEVGAEAMLHVGKESVTLAGDYQANMNRVQFITGATAQEMQEYSKAAINIGKTTTFSSKTAAEGLANLAQMGYKGKDAINLLSTSANAAMINNIDLGEATNIVTSTLHGFGLSTEQSGHALDVMSRASQLGKLSFEDFGKEAENVGLVAKAADQSFETTTSLMLALGNTGMTAARGSQTLRNAITQMEKPTKAAEKSMQDLGLSYYDANGHFKNMIDIFGEVQQKTANMSEEQRNLTINTLFGKNGVMAYNAAVNAQVKVMKDGREVTLHGVEALKYMQGQLENSNGTVDKASKIMMSGFNASLKNMKGSLEEAAITIGTGFLPPLTDLLKGATEGINKFIDWGQQTQFFNKLGSDLAAFLKKDFVPVVKDLGKGFLELIKIWEDRVMPVLKAVKLGFSGEWIPEHVKTIPALFATIAHDLHVTFDKTIDSIHGLKAGFSGKWIPKEVHTIPAFFARVGHDIHVVVGDVLGDIKAFKDGFSGGLLPMSDLKGIHSFFAGLGKKVHEVFGDIAKDISDFKDGFSGGLLPMDELRGIPGFFAELGQKVHDAIPAIEGFYDKAQPLIATAIHLYETFSPLGIAFDVIKGFMTGGVQGAIDAFTAKLGDMGKTIGDLWPKVLDGVQTIGSGLLNWIAQIAPQIGSQLLQWGKQFLDWIGPQIPGMLAALGEMANQFFGWLGQQVPLIVEQLAKWGKEFVDWIIPHIPDMFNALAQLGGQLFTWIGDQVPKLMDQLMQWGKSFVEWINKDVLPNLLPTLEQIGKQVLQFILDKGPEILGQLFQWGAAFIDWVMKDVMPNIDGALLQIGGAVLKFVGDAALQIGGKIIEWGKAFLGWVADVMIHLPGELAKIIGAIWDWITKSAGEAWGKALEIGKGIINGIVKGIGDGVGAIKDAIGKAIGDPIGFAKNLLGIKSPSKVFYDIGGNVIKGYVQGITGGVEDVKNALAGVVAPGIDLAAAKPASGPVAGAASGSPRSNNPIQEAFMAAGQAIDRSTSNTTHINFTANYQAPRNDPMADLKMLQMLGNRT